MMLETYINICWQISAMYLPKTKSSIIVEI